MKFQTIPAAALQIGDKVRHDDGWVTVSFVRISSGNVIFYGNEREKGFMADEHYPLYILDRKFLNLR